MQDFKKPHPKTPHLLRLAGALAGAILLFVTAGVAVTSAWGMYGTFSTAAGARQSAEKSLRSIQEDETRISATVAALGSQTGVEKEVRERFGVAKPGEGEIQIVRDAAGEDVRPAESQNVFLKTLHSLFVW